MLLRPSQRIMDKEVWITLKTTNTRRVKLQDIAAKTGYSINTVSHALRGMPDISAATAGHIREVARAMGYTPNQVASSLRSGHTRTLAVILGSMSNPFYGLMTDTIQDAAMQSGYTLMIMCARDDAALEYHLAEQAIARRADGLLLFPTGQSQPTIQRLREARMPFVLMSRYLERDQADCVICDEEQGAYLATRHLLEHGLRRLAYVSGSTVIFSSEQRIRGFLRACDEADLPPANRRICVMSGHPAAKRQPKYGMIPAERLLALKRDGFDGLFIFCDVQAWHVLNILRTSNELRPRDFGIVSFDNIEGALSFPISLCSIDCDYEQMAQHGIELLRARIGGDTRPPQTIVCPVRLVCRGSCNRNSSAEC